MLKLLYTRGNLAFIQSNKNISVTKGNIILKFRDYTKLILRKDTFLKLQSPFSSSFKNKNKADIFDFSEKLKIVFLSKRFKKKESLQINKSYFKIMK